MFDLATELKAKAFKRTHPEGVRPGGWEWCAADSGNFDDTYEYGVTDGEILFARELLKKIFHLTDAEITANLEPLED